MIRSLVLGPVETNVYFVINDENNECVIVDPADKAEVIQGRLRQNGLTAKAILLTHGHFDHIAGISGLINGSEEKMPIYAAETEKRLLSDGELNQSLMVYGRSITVDVDHYLKDGEEFEAAGISFKCIHTPGHTEGSCCYYIESMKTLISGDTLFEGSVGRTDLPTGSMKVMMKTIREKILPIADDTEVYPGHGGVTTIGDEKRWNPFFNDTYI
ncbi:MAG: MBL fold metallo-hydrolase [Lachnospiraceae bacterium]|nr:MBL fold metallo-hydrolase [Lachnospiraceae bacterium]